LKKKLKLNPPLAGYEREMFRELIFACLSPAAAGRVCKDSEIFRPNSQWGAFLLLRILCASKENEVRGAGAGKAPQINKILDNFYNRVFEISIKKVTRMGVQVIRHTGESRYPEGLSQRRYWVPAFAGKTSEAISNLKTWFSTYYAVQIGHV
jgi:hypothetical protein